MTNRIALQASNLSKRVISGENELQILQDLNLTVAAATSLSIVGSSGAGKSTLLALLAGLDNPTDGEVALLGQSLSDLTEDERAELRAGNVGFVFQSFQLLNALTALENVMLPLELAGIAEAKQKAIDTLQQVGLGERVNHRPKQLSGGEQQRVALARAFAVRPGILFADEPTGNLDRKTSDSIVELLFELNAATGTTLILVTHDPQLAQRCQRQVELRDGRLFEAGVALSATPHDNTSSGDSDL